MDGEAAQAQGLSDELVLYAVKIPELDSSIPRNDLDLLMMVLKTCSIHFEQQVEYWLNFLELCILIQGIETLTNFPTLFQRKQLHAWRDLWDLRLLKRFWNGMSSARILLKQLLLTGINRKKITHGFFLLSIALLLKWIMKAGI